MKVKYEVNNGHQFKILRLYLSINLLVRSPLKMIYGTSISNEKYNLLKVKHEGDEKNMFCLLELINEKTMTTKLLLN